MLCISTKITNDVELYNDNFFNTNTYDTVLKRDDLKRVIEKESSGLFFVIDNADLLLDTNIRRTIAFDCSNQYLIIGRNSSDLMLVPENVCGLTFENSTLAITEQL